jgi:hypothetical protein
MNTQSDLKWIHQEIDKVKDDSFIEKLKHLLQNFGKVESDENYNLDIDQALQSISEGNFYSENDAKSISKKWGKQ